MCWVAWTALTLPKYEGGLGFRDLETFNDALLARIGWRIMRNPSSLVARVLLGKYCKLSTFWDCTIATNASHGWRSVLAGREILKQGTGWEVGNGESIHVWGEPWLSLAYPLGPMGPPTAGSSTLMVSDLLCPLTNTWRRDLVGLHLPQYETDVDGLFTSSVAQPDRRIWLHDPSGEYTTKTGYNLAITAKTARQEHPLDWQKHIWSVKTSPKVKDFLWRLAKKAIPVSANLATRGLPAFPCKRCGGIEDDLHTFLLCPLAQEVWTLAPLTSQPQVFIPSIYHFLSNGSQFIPLPPLGLSNPLWPWLLWRLWKARNWLAFEEKRTSAQEIINLAIRDAKEWQAAQEVIGAKPNVSCLPVIAPPLEEGSLVCFVDAAWDVTTRNCGFAGIFKGSVQGQQLNFKDSRRQVDSALTAEALAVRKAVMEAYISNAESLVVLSDSQVLIKILQTGGARKELNNILVDIHHFSSRLTACSFLHISRLCNVEADLVAKSALVSVNSPSPCGG